MELVYLWVEDYKNIKKQGFNFSPRFHCEYDEETNELTINENDDYIPNFFGENINVTAIVGKNGSGKSSVLETISEFIESEPRKGRLWIEENNKIFEYTHLLGLYFPTILFSDNKIEEISYYNHIDYFLKQQTHIPFKEKLDNLLISLFTYNNDLSYISELDYLPTHVELYLSRRFTKVEKQLLVENISSSNKKEVNEIYTFILLLEHNLINTIKSYPTKSYNYEGYFYIKDFVSKLINRQEDYCKVAHSLVSMIMDSEEFLNLKYHHNTVKYSVEEFSKIDLLKLLKDKVYENEVEKFFNQFIQNFINSNYSLDEGKILVELKDNNLEEIALNIEREYFELNFYKYKNGQKIYYKNLSSGERTFIQLFSKLSFYLKPYIKNIYYMREQKRILNNKKVILLLDEPDMNLHPYWQKKFISYLIQFVTQTIGTDNMKIHIILTTHSPFILSDIPKDNIIFLNKNEDGNCVITNGLLYGKQTFGANIHTLLSDSFFMEDGLMGEFAKQKINEIIAFFDNENELYKNDQDKLLKIINSIGEPFLKDKLLFMYNEKYPKTDEEKILELEKQIESIKNGQD